MISGLYFNLSKNLSYIPLPNPTRLNFLSIPIIGTTAISIFCFVLFLFFGSYILNCFFIKGKEYFTILKLNSSINGTKIFLFFILSFFISCFVSTSLSIEI